jgi:hypothetical protein
MAVLALLHQENSGRNRRLHVTAGQALLVSIRESAFKDRYPADHYNRCTTDKPGKEHDLDGAHTKDDQLETH